MIAQLAGTGFPVSESTGFGVLPGVSACPRPKPQTAHRRLRFGRNLPTLSSSIALLLLARWAFHPALSVSHAQPSSVPTLGPWTLRVQCLQQGTTSAFLPWRKSWHA